jgi:DeoR family transcriptional regulator of aga operon
MRLSTPDLLEAQLNKVMMQISNEVTVITDASKIGRRSLSVIGDLSEARRLVTDNGVNEDALKKIRHTGIEVVIA